MPRVNVDSALWTDPRARRLALELGWSMRLLVGTLCAVWDAAYSRKSAILSDLDIDTAAETPGFAAKMAHPDVGLAHSTARNGKQLGKNKRLSGVDRRIQYLRDQAERGALGGKAKRNARKTVSENGLANAKHSPSELEQSPSLPLALSPDLALALAPALAPDRKAGEAGTGPARAIDPSLDLARYLFEAIKIHTPHFGADPRKWANDIRLILTADKAKPETIRAAIDFAHKSRDPFWRGRIVSGKALRDKLGTLTVQAANPQRAPAGRGGGLTAEELLNGPSLFDEKGNRR